MPTAPNNAPTLRRLSPLTLATAFFAAAGLLVTVSLGRLSDAAPRPPAPSQAEPAGKCPLVAQQPGGVRVVSYQEAQPAPPDAPAEVKPEENPEGKNSPGCVHCHQGVEPSHASGPSALTAFGCVGCHGGNPKEMLDKEKAHVQPRYPELWGKRGKVKQSGNPQETYTLLNRERPEFIRFINPGDLRVQEQTCGAKGCHGGEEPVNGDNIVLKVRMSMMTHGGFLYGSALYNNSAYPYKDARYGESYGPHGEPQRIVTLPRPSAQDQLLKGILPLLDPLPHWEISQAGNVLRVFERGGGGRGEIGNPNVNEETGRPDVKLSFRGHGTLNRTDPTVLGIQKTRLFDPTLNFLGTNDQPGDYRSSGCSGCHNVYANDKDPFHSAQYAAAGCLGQGMSADKALADARARGERGHPIRHGMTNQIPTSQCISCHVHPGTNMLTTYLGYTWWDNETDGEGMYAKRPIHRSAEEQDEIQRRNPEGAALKGKWGDPKFLENDLQKLNPGLKHTQFAGFNGHGWVFRAVYKRDRKGNLLDVDGKTLPEEVGKLPQTPKEPGPDAKPEPGSPVHLKDIHLEKGMHCVDCHFKNDNHGDALLHNEPRGMLTLQCTDCHGTITQRANPTLDPEDAGKGVPGSSLFPFRRMTLTESKRRFRAQSDGTLIQYSAVTPDLQWEVPQVIDTITPGNKHYSERARLAKTMQRDGKTWGVAPPAGQEGRLAHSSSSMTCYTCHSSWTTSCFGCHLSMTANQKKPSLHDDGGVTRNWTSYNFQTLRDDLYMLGKEGTVPAPKDAQGNPHPRTVPVRSSCAILVSSQNADREWLYYQQQTVSSEGFAGTAFSPYVPHTVRGKETKGCTDCHPSAKGDNNAWLANLYLLGSKAVNFVGRNCWVATGKGFQGVQVAERDEPGAVIGSTLHRLAYPEEFGRHLKRDRELTGAHEHDGEALRVQQRGEYLYAAEGAGGLVVYDIANIENKGFSERITTAPVSPLGQRFYVRTRYATDVASPSTMALDPARTQRPENQEGKIHPLYAYLYVTDKYEGLILVNAATLLDGNPTNNFLKRALTWNPGGVLNGATSIQIAGAYAYVTCDRGLVIVNVDDPLHPKIAAEIGAPELQSPRAVAVQFRYVFVVDAAGLKVVDVTVPERAKVVAGAQIPLQDAWDVYVSRTYAYVAAGRQGLAIVDVETPAHPKLEQLYTADGKLDDTRAVRIGMTNNSTIAYVADGKNGMRVVQLTSPESTPGIYGYSPKPTPQLIAWFKTDGPALAVSEGLDRDRAVDETGNQLSVFGRRGARPLNLEERNRMLYSEDGKGPLLQVSDTPPGPPQEPMMARAGLRWGGSLALFLLPMLGIGIVRRMISPRRLGDSERDRETK